MEEKINQISKKTLEELKKANKPPYPFYYKNLFISIAQDEGVFEQLNPKLLDINVNESLLDKTKSTIQTVDKVSKDIKDDSINLLDEIDSPMQIDEIKNTIHRFGEDLLNKVNSLEETVKNLEKELDKAYKELLIDPLTKSYNRKALEKDLNEILDYGKEKELDLIIAAVDIDHFKEINDTHGHLVGDFVLIKFIYLIRKSIRSEHKIYRYGGDEFILVFNRTTLDKVEPIIKRIIEKIEHTKLKYKDKIITLTTSIGLTKHKKGDTFEAIIKRADEALYKAKINRNSYEIKE